MTEMMADITSVILLMIGSFFVVGGAVGTMRFPDFYSRLHSAGVTDTLGAILILVGLMFLTGWTLITVKLIFIGLFLFITGPTATHAIANAALTAGLRPFLSSSAEHADGPAVSSAQDREKE